METVLTNARLILDDGVVAGTLTVRDGRIAAVEVMLNNDAVANMIRKGKAYQIPSAITTGRDVGMQSMDNELARLTRAGIVESEEAFMKAFDKAAFETMISGERSEASDHHDAAEDPRREPG